MTVDGLDSKALLSEFAARVKHHRVWNELNGFLKQFVDEAFREFTEFREDDAAKLMALRARWLARKDFQGDIESLVNDQAELQQEIREEFQSRGHDASVLDDFSNIRS
jgi:hypothetical protein